MPTTPVPFTDARDVASRERSIIASISAKVARRPRVDNQGRHLDPPISYSYDEYGRLIAADPPLDAA